MVRDHRFYVRAEDVRNAPYLPLRGARLNQVASHLSTSHFDGFHTLAIYGPAIVYDADEEGSVNSWAVNRLEWAINGIKHAFGEPESEIAQLIAEILKDLTAEGFVIRSDDDIWICRTIARLDPNLN